MKVKEKLLNEVTDYFIQTGHLKESEKSAYMMGFAFGFDAAKGMVAEDMRSIKMEFSETAAKFIEGMGEEEIPENLPNINLTSFINEKASGAVH